MSLAGLWPYFCVHLLFTWHDLCDWFQSDGCSIPCPYISVSIVFLKTSVTGVLLHAIAVALV
jgi:hypothetical protein